MATETTPALDRAFINWQRKRDAWLHHPYSSASRSHPDYPSLEADYLAAARESEHALGELFATPSPDIDGLARKLETYASEYEGSNFDEDRFALIVSDARRLAGEA